MTSCKFKNFPLFQIVCILCFHSVFFERYFKHKNKFERFISMDYTNFRLNFHCLSQNSSKWNMLSMMLIVSMLILVVVVLEMHELYS